LRAWAIWEGVTSYRAWGALDESVATGRTAFDQVFGRPFFDYFAAHPEVGAQFDAAMTDFTAGIAAAVAEEYDFPGRRTVVDVGGGRGHVLAAVLRAHPALEGILFDLPGVVPAATAYLAGAGLAGRTRVVAGDFFGVVPAGADAYVLCHIVHDWDDARAIRILQNCRAAVAPAGILLIVEKYMPEPMVPGAVPPGTDVNMLVLTGGRERTEREYRALLAAGGWRLTRVLPTSSVSSIFEAAPA
jgi:SAM-dependent methyltransferase